MATVSGSVFLCVFQSAAYCIELMSINQSERSWLSWRPVSVFNKHVFLYLEDRTWDGVGQEKETQLSATNTYSEFADCRAPTVF